MQKHVKRVKIQDIASDLGIATSTVSRAINNKAGVGEQLRCKILERAKAMGYHPNPIAMQLRMGHSKIIGLIVPRINRNFFSNVIHGVETIAKQKGYSVLISQSNESEKDEAECIHSLINQRVAGVLISISIETKNTDQLQTLIDNNTPFVMFDRVFEELNEQTVTNNNLKAAEQTVQHLLDQGYNKIVHLGGAQHINIYRDRYQGYCQALQKNNIDIDEQLVFHETITRQAGEKAIQHLIDNQITFDAVFCSGDYAALGATLKLKKLGISIPEEVGVTGWANEPFTELLGITSLDQHSKQIGQLAGELLMQKIHNNKAQLVKNLETQFLPSLIIRESSSKK